MKAGAQEIVIQDIICTALPKKDGANPTGQFAGVVRKGFVDNPNRSKEIFESIANLTEIAASKHREQNCDGNHLKPESANHIVRLVTNEFMFYTKTPLSLAEFESLQQQIADLAAKQPENLHLVLGSFAVKSSDGPDAPVMNVVPHIQCGTDPKINFLVKNIPSELDPVYSEKSLLNGRTVHDNLGIKATPEQVGTKAVKDELDSNITINGKAHPFSFNNTIICKTAGNESFFSCVEICYDHHFGIARNRLTEQLKQAVERAGNGEVSEPLPTLCSHIITSNVQPALPSKKLSEVVTHADPKYSPTECKLNTKKSHRDEMPIVLGSQIDVVTTSPLACGPLLQEAHRELVQSHNEKVVAPTAAASRANTAEAKPPAPAAITPVEKMSSPTAQAATKSRAHSHATPPVATVKPRSNTQTEKRASVSGSLFSTISKSTKRLSGVFAKNTNHKEEKHAPPPTASAKTEPSTAQAAQPLARGAIPNVAKTESKMEERPDDNLFTPSPVYTPGHALSASSAKNAQQPAAKVDPATVERKFRH